MSSHIETITGRAVVLHGDDVDTDRIMPARFLKAVTFDGLDAHVFEDDRRALAERGERHPFDGVPEAGGPASRPAILIAGANFGCGSSREHAPQALARWGLRAILAESFAEIFAGNAQMIGLPCVTAARADLERLRHRVEIQPSLDVVVDLASMTIRDGSETIAAHLPDSARAAFLSGNWDSTGLLLDSYDDVQAVAERLPYLIGFR